MFDNFNSAASYSGPAAVRLLRANCGQTPNARLYEKVPANCYLMAMLEKAGFKPEIALNHDGHFDDFLPVLRNQGLYGAPVDVTDVPVIMHGFDDSPIYDDLGVLTHWQMRRARQEEGRVALYYSSISLHDGNRLIRLPELNSQVSYATRVKGLLDDLDRFMAQLEREGRRSIVILIPEHGAAYKGDALQVAGLREIPSPSITRIPVGIRVIGAQHQGVPVRVQTGVSYQALAEFIGQIIERPPYDAGGFVPSRYTKNLSQTPFVAENEEVTVMQYGNRYYWRQEHSPWTEHPYRKGG